MSTFIKDPNFNYTPYTLIYDEPIKETLNNADWKVILDSIDELRTLTFSPSFEEIGLDFTVININSITWNSSSDTSPFYEIDDVQITTIDNTEKPYLELSSNNILILSDFGVLFYKFQNASSIGGQFTINFTQLG
jgi:hypothetical protein